MNCRFPALAVVLLATCMAAAAQEAAAPAPDFTAELSIVRYDLPRGRSNGYAPTRQLARRKDPPDGVDWPEFTLNGQPIFRSSPRELVPMQLRRGGAARPLFQVAGDEVIQPGNHWLRPVQWLRNRKHLYTADKTARTANAGEAARGRYELWLFPILIKGEGGPVIKNVVLKNGGVTIYEKHGPWRTLTLLLPANEPHKPYELIVDGRPPVQFDAGLMPVKLGNPQERVYPVSLTIGGEGPRLLVQNLAQPEIFPNQADWTADVAALSTVATALKIAPSGEDYAAAGRRIEETISPLLIYAAALPHGMSGGFWKKGTNAEEYAARVAELGFDAVFEQGNAFGAADHAESMESRASAFVLRGLRLGLQYDNNWARPSLQHPNLAFFAHTLPEWHAPLYRSLQLTAQRFARLPNFVGISIGSDNAGYVPFWSWAPPIPDRPWGEAMIEFAHSSQPKVPRAPSLGPREFPHEQPVKTQADFMKYVERYEVSFRQYGYFAEAVREVDPQLTFTTGSFGSSPGEGGRGGWPWASIPGRVMHEGLKVQQIYDWNELHSSKPLHNVALVDRMRSYAPRNATWSLVDNFKLFFGREALQRAYALVLTRGVQGVGTNFLPDQSRPEVFAAYRDLHTWIKRYAGVYATTEPEPVIGVFYGHLQAVTRRVVTDENASPELLARGSHEGKVTEALWLCHAAGWPARVITYQELMRGPLPPSMKAILLVGLDQPDESWHWGPGLDVPLQQFLARGGRILADDESVCPVPFTKTPLRIASYVPQSELDATPRLLARNQENRTALRAAMDGVPPPIASSDSATLWAIPTRSGDTQYVTAVNWAFAEGEETKEVVRPLDPRAAKPEVWKTKANASLYVKPQTGTLRWQTERPIYDVRLQRKLSAEEAARCDLTQEGFRWYALPPREVMRPEVTVSRGAKGFEEVQVSMGEGMSGVPVSVTATGEKSVTVFGVTGTGIRLPLESIGGSGPVTVLVTELLSGLSAQMSHKPETQPQPSTRDLRRENAALAKFATRKHVPLTIALTAEQQQDRTASEAAKTLARFYEQQGRKVRIGRVAPHEVIVSLQPLSSPHRYPQWKTVPSDLVLFGTPTSNVLILDQHRGELFPRDFAVPAGDAAELHYMRSPFVGEYDAVNIIASSTAALKNAAQELIKRSTPPAPR